MLFRSYFNKKATKQINKKTFGETLARVLDARTNIKGLTVAQQLVFASTVKSLEDRINKGQKLSVTEYKDYKKVLGDTFRFKELTKNSLKKE